MKNKTNSKIMCGHQGVGDATPAIFVALIMFAIPGTKEGGPLLNWKLVQVRVETL